ncbi:molybdopterin molybdotransferase MoeA [Labrys wisconsinensis]|uniref:Molybdopterin molybdenumtransferase n=1 Tax=Labrys wisconsinensis TaxID=425677 RepID=A0ABU0J4V1_9HYPH|nr:gephyrin-like molybdotransferase Glp [Labrys wisconsinensis]MDQ0469297.1 molybdopterin molybdotransferase [Labrys wisconsinensis]
MTDLLPVADALAQVLAGVEALPVERVPLLEARGRVLAETLVARRTQPGFDASAMDGYALRAAEAAEGAALTVIGESAAGHAFSGRFATGEAVRIFTGAPVPDGADAVLIQENARREGDVIRVTVAPRPGQNIRRRGLDFRDGDPALAAGKRLGPRDLALAAATNHPALPVHRRPRVAILATGDEIVLPGAPAGPHQIVASNTFALAAMAQAEGADVIDLGIAGDTMAALEAAIRRARDAEADVLVTIGGASVGDRDLVQAALTREGMSLGFWKIAMRPGKPMMHGGLGRMRILGLPGNPVSAIVCGVLFLVPLIRALSGRGDRTLARRPARFAVDWPANDFREDYLRATFALDAAAELPMVTPFAVQDSSMVSVLAGADCLAIRPPHAPAAQAGDPCEIIDLNAAGY